MNIINSIINYPENLIIDEQFVDKQAKIILRRYAESKGIHFPKQEEYDEDLAKSNTKEENQAGVGCGSLIIFLAILTFLTAIVTDWKEAKKPLVYIGGASLVLGVGYIRIHSNSNLTKEDQEAITEARKIRQQNLENKKQFYVNSLKSIKEDYKNYVTFLLTYPSPDEIEQYKKDNCSSSIEEELFSQTIKYNEEEIKLGEKNLGSKCPCVGNSIGCTVTLEDDYVVINKGAVFKALNFFDTDSNTVKIPLDSITVINHKPSGILDGYLEFVYQGFIPRSNDQSKHAQENVITFRGAKENDLFLAFKNMAEEKVKDVKNKRSSSSSPNTYIAEELQKLANLYEKGILTEDEFKIQKQKLIGS